jgi:TPR repeat protein
LLCLATPGLAGQLEDGKTAMDQKDYMKAMDLWTPLAEQGNAEAQYYIGQLYDKGLGVPIDHDEAVKWYHKSAMTTDAKDAVKAAAPVDDRGQIAWLKQKVGEGDVSAAIKLGDTYQAQKRDPVEALKWYQKAAELGSAEALYDIGTFYDAGAGVRQDPAEAMRWYIKAADKGFGKAQVHLGWLYATANPKDYVEAMRWYTKAAEQGHYHYTIGVMQLYAQNEIGDMYLHGWGVPADAAKAFIWYLQAATRGSTEAQYNLSRLYAEGKGVPEDKVEAYFWLTLCARDPASGVPLPANALTDAAKRLNDEELQAVKVRVMSWKVSGQ